jgi:hypothetical protein
MVRKRIVSVDPQLRALLARHDKDVQALALGLRDVVIDALAPCHEYAFQMRSKTVLLYGATSHAIEDNICNIAVLRRHVTLTFRHGAEFRDPRALLRGSGQSCVISGSSDARTSAAQSYATSFARRGATRKPKALPSSAGTIGQ